MNRLLLGVLTLVLCNALVRAAEPSGDVVIDGDDEFKKSIHDLLDKKISLELKDGTTLYAAVLLLRGLSSANVIVDPKLGAAKLALKIEGTQTKNAIDQICKLVSAGWDVRNGAIFIFPGGKAPPRAKIPQAKDPWEVDTLKKLATKIRLNFVDFGVKDIVGQISDLTKVNISLDPKFVGNRFDDLNKIPVTLEVSKMRADDALTWICYFAGAEWTLKKDDGGVGTVWITKRTEK